MARGWPVSSPDGVAVEDDRTDAGVEPVEVVGDLFGAGADGIE